ncbi:MAG: MazG-related protein [Patescibacteria group bacterium]
MKEEKNTEGAFRWIVGLLQKHSIPFQISGGFAARLYGSKRDLADIDIGIPDDRFDDLYPEVKQYIIYGPEHYLDDEWDLKLMTLKYENQEIDIAGRDEVKIFDKSKKVWVPAHRDLTVSEDMEVYGIVVPVIPKKSLISYKSKIARDVDLEDIRQLEISMQFPN